MRSDATKKAAFSDEKQRKKPGSVRCVGIVNLLLTKRRIERYSVDFSIKETYTWKWNAPLLLGIKQEGAGTIFRPGGFGIDRTKTEV